MEKLYVASVIAYAFAILGILSNLLLVYLLFNGQLRDNRITSFLIASSGKCTTFASYTNAFACNSRCHLPPEKRQ